MLPKETLRWIEQGERRCRSSTGANGSTHVAASEFSVAFYLRQPLALGNDKGAAPDGSLADRCRECQDLDRRGLQYRTVLYRS